MYLKIYLTQKISWYCLGQTHYIKKATSSFASDEQNIRAEDPDEVDIDPLPDSNLAF